jgi:TPR repeat protein
MRYVRGDGVPKDYAEAVKWIRKSAEQDYAEGQRQLANAYFNGRGVEKDYGRAFEWYEQAAKQGNIEAESGLGVCYQFGYGVQRNLPEANDWYRKAAQLNNAYAQNNLGNSLMQGLGISKDVVQGYKWILLSAAQGNPFAIKSVNAYESKLTPAQLAEARALADAFRAADLSGSTTALQPLPTASQTRSIAENATPTPSRKSSPGNFLGLEPLPTVPPSVNPWGQGQARAATMQERAEAGDAAAQCELGLAYVNGNGVAKNYAEAFKWLHKSAEQNNTVAQYNLGVCYANGFGTAKSMVEACKWYRKAADQNYSDAQFNLGLAYFNGQGVRKNPAEACRWYLKAAEQNDASAMGNLGYCYGNGFGVPSDDVQAYKWLSLAVARGANENVQRMLAALERRMSRAAIAQGQKLAQEFQPSEGGGQQQVPSPGGGSQSADGPLQPHETGTGFFVTNDGYLITNFHVVKDGAAVRLMTRHAKVPATVVQVDATNDLALLKAEGIYKALPVGESFDVKLGDTVSTIGFPLIDLQGVSPKFTRGEISSLAGPKDDVRFFQISTPIQPGNSGGALVDEHGNVVGVTSQKLSAAYLLKRNGAIPENVNYAIKSYLVRDFLKWTVGNSDKLKPSNTDQDKPADLIDQMQEAAALVVVYWHTAK